MSVSLDSINRRKFDRFTFQDTFVLETENFTVISNTSSKNLSKKGALLLSPKPIPEGSVIAIEIPAQKLQLMGEVRWIQPENDQYGIGVVFHELFPNTKHKISDLVDHIQPEKIQEEESTFSLALEQSIASFLNPYIEEIQPEPVNEFSGSYRRLGAAVDNGLSFYTPVKHKSSDTLSTSFRIDEFKKPFSFPLKTVFFTLAIFGSLAFYVNTHQKLFIKFLPEITTDSAKISSTHSNPITGQVELDQGTIEKVEWMGTNDRLEIKFSFRNKIEPSQIEFSRINSEQPRELIKITGVENKIDQKNISIQHPFVDQIRLGLHDENAQTSLHIVIPVTNSTITITSKEQTEKTLTINLETTAAHR